jgi:deferrochelatase/peroxidase EfeB
VTGCPYHQGDGEPGRGPAPAPPPASPGGPRLGRRAFLGSAAGAAALGLGAAACGAAEERERQPGKAALPFAGPHQAGVTTPAAQFAMMAAFTIARPDRAALATTLRALTDEIRSLMAGRLPAARDAAFPPAETGILGPDFSPERLAVSVSVGASLFDQRFGLADRRPRELIRMPFLSNDRLDPKLSHGDLLLTLSSERQDVLIHALRQLMRRTRDNLVLHWLIDGYSRPDSKPVPGRSAGGGVSHTSNRNLLGFKDGTANLDISDQGLMNRHVWVAAEDDEPGWTAGGSYQAVRIIRTFVEFWDRTPLAEQESIIGRHKSSGAPLGQADESATPNFEGDPKGLRVPLDAHIRLANPRTGSSDENLILRRGFNYHSGFDDAGQLNQGLAFISYQRSLVKGFLTVQGRLKGEPLEEYILPVGGGFFFTLPGVTSDDGWLGQGLLA